MSSRVHIMKNFPVVILCLFLGTSAQAKVSFPEGFKLCHRDDPNINACFEDAMVTDSDLLKDGYPPDLPPLQPIPGGTLSLSVGNERIGVHLNTVLSNFTLTYTLLSVSNPNVDRSTGEFTVDGHFKDFTAHATHDTTGRFVVTNLAGKGRFEATLHDCIMTMEARVQDVERDGVVYWYLDNVTFKNKQASKVTADFDLVANKAINNAIIKTLNDNYEVMLLPLIPQLVDHMAPMVQDQINNVLFNRVPLDELLPPGTE